MARWSKKPDLAAALEGLPLTSEEGFVLSRLDTPLTHEQLIELTGLASERIENILSLLEDKGLIVSDTPSMRPIQATIPDTDLDDSELPTPPRGLPAPPSNAPPSNPPPSAPPSMPPSDPSPSVQPPPWSEPPPRQELELDPNLLDASFQKIYDQRLRHLPLETRIALAGRQTRETLFALCLDPEAVVIRAVLMNPELVRSHARVIAMNHPDPAGLELLAHTRDLLGDAQVEWLLLRNPRLPEELAREILTPKGLNGVFEVWADSVVAESARVIAREIIRTRFATAPAEERAGLICGTEGNVLPALAGLTLDGRTMTILCSRSYTSIVFVRNLVKFSSCPGPLLAYLSKQTLVRRNPQLRTMVMAHPNTPIDVKRRV